MGYRREARLRFLLYGTPTPFTVQERHVYFFVYYELEDDESKHALSLYEYGQSEATNAWVLLEAEK